MPRDISRIKPADKTIVDKDGKILFYSMDDFINKIAKGDDCFVCGAKKGSKKFNDEHVLPDWILSRYDLYDKTITLPNGRDFMYGKYKVPCCEDCNTELGRSLEKPVSELLKLPHNQICEIIKEDQSKLFLLFQWLILIFFKTHIKDTVFYCHLDKRKGEEKIGDRYDWEFLHHLHCMVRANYTNARIDSKVMGSVIILPSIEHPSIEPFDFSDYAPGQGVMLRLNEFSIVCILNDCCGSWNIFTNMLKKINGPVTNFQLRDIFTHMVYINMHLQERPIFYSEFNENGERYIRADIPEKPFLVEEKDRAITRGELLYQFCGNSISESKDRDNIIKEIREGKRQYLFNEKGEFINHSKDFINDAE